jgi:hypothetical protein
MATTTTNYGFDIPQSTDLVKDGATAIATLGQDIDTAMNTALGTKKAGMVLVKTTTIGTTVSSVNVDDVFSANYDNYVIQFNSSSASAAGENINLRLRVSGADNSSNNYYWSLAYVPFSGTATVTGSNGSGLTSSFVVSYVVSTNGGASTINLYNPFSTAPTRFHSVGGGGSNDAILTRGGITSVTTSYTGFTLIAGSGTLTGGSIKVYGWNQ